MPTNDVNVIAKNITGSEIFIYDLGISIPANSSRALYEEFKDTEIAASNNLQTLVSSGTIVINNGVRDLTISEALTIFDEVVGFELEQETRLIDVLTRGNDAGTLTIKNLGIPVDPYDAATKIYVDSFAPSNSPDVSIDCGTIITPSENLKIDCGSIV